MSPGRCHFNEKWLEKDGCKSWLWKDDKNPNKAFCFACKKSIEQNIGLNANTFFVCGKFLLKKVLEISK